MAPLTAFQVSRRFFLLLAKRIFLIEGVAGITRTRTVLELSLIHISCHDCSFAFYTFFYKQKGKNKKIIHWILWLLTVPFIFWMVQIIAVELIIPGASEPSVRTLRATIPENESRQIF